MEQTNSDRNFYVTATMSSVTNVRQIATVYCTSTEEDVYWTTDLSAGTMLEQRMIIFSASMKVLLSII